MSIINDGRRTMEESSNLNDNGIKMSNFGTALSEKNISILIVWKLIKIGENFALVRARGR